VPIAVAANSALKKNFFTTKPPADSGGTGMVLKGGRKTTYRFPFQKRRAAVERGPANRQVDYRHGPKSLEGKVLRSDGNSRRLAAQGSHSARVSRPRPAFGETLAERGSLGASRCRPSATKANYSDPVRACAPRWGWKSWNGADRGQPSEQVWAFWRLQRGPGEMPASVFSKNTPFPRVGGTIPGLAAKSAGSRRCAAERRREPWEGNWRGGRYRSR